MNTAGESGGGQAEAGGGRPRQRPGRKVVTGIVVSDKMQKTRSVEVMRLERQPKYGKFIRRYTTFKVHDEQELSKQGDTVRIIETRPLSKTKRWRLVEVVSRSRLGGVKMLAVEDLADGQGGSLAASPGAGVAPAEGV